MAVEHVLPGTGGVPPMYEVTLSVTCRDDRPVQVLYCRMGRHIGLLVLQADACMFIKRFAIYLIQSLSVMFTLSLTCIFGQMSPNASIPEECSILSVTGTAESSVTARAYSSCSSLPEPTTNSPQNTRSRTQAFTVSFLTAPTPIFPFPFLRRVSSTSCRTSLPPLDHRPL